MIRLLVQKDYKPGDPEPEGYLAWREWAEVQHKAGLRQVECGRCGRWCYPQQLSETLDRCEVKNRRGERELMASRVCLKCDGARGASHGQS